mgnify:CR=1 FL=1
MVRRLVAAGLKEIEAASFVSPKWVPQMADAAEVMAGITRTPGISYAALTPNMKGYEGARAASASEIAIFASASEGFSRANLNCTIAESLERLAPVAAAARAVDMPAGAASAVAAQARGAGLAAWLSAEPQLAELGSGLADPSLRPDLARLGLADEHIATEKMLADSGIAYALLRNGWYTENYTQGAPGAVAQGALFGCADEGRIASAGRADYAEAAAIVLASDQHREPVYELAGDSAYTLGELAAVIARQSGQRVDYVNVSEADYVSALQQAGLPKEFASVLADADRGVAKGALLDEGHQLSQLLGRPTLSLEEAVKQALSSSR